MLSQVRSHTHAHTRACADSHKRTGAGRRTTRLGINYVNDQMSDWGLAELIIWDRHLSNQEMEQGAAHLAWLIGYEGGSFSVAEAAMRQGISLQLGHESNQWRLETELAVDVSPVAMDGMRAWFKSVDAAAPAWKSAVGDWEASVAQGTATVRDESGFGATTEVKYLAGDTGTQLNFGGILTSSFTMCSLSRYTSSDTKKQGRIIAHAAGGQNFLHGHFAGVVGGVYYEVL